MEDEYIKEKEKAEKDLSTDTGHGDKIEKAGFWKGFLCGVCIILLIAAGIFSGGKITEFVNNGGVKTSKLITDEIVTKSELLKKAIDYYYLEGADETKLADGIYSGIIDSLEDPYSTYLSEETLTKFMESYNGTYCGIGASLLQDKQTGIIKIVRAFDGSPAMEAGLTAGDIIYKVEDREVTGEELSNVVLDVKGEENTIVHITIVRDGEMIDVEMPRRKIEVPTVEYEMKENKIGYILITEFDEVTASQFTKALTDLQNQGMESLIVDLRDNPGGGLQVVVQILDDILPEGLIVYQEDKYGNKEEYTSDAENYIDIPLAVLINGNSASASEIFAGAIKDYGAGTLIGTTTFGKGIVQRLIELGDGTAVKLTISKYYTPKGVCIHGIGIEPDVEVELDYEAYKDSGVDNQLQKAIEILGK